MKIRSKLFIGAATSALLALSAAPALAAGPEVQQETGSFNCANSVKKDVGNGILNILNDVHVNLGIVGKISDGIDQQCEQSQSEKAGQN